MQRRDIPVLDAPKGRRDEFVEPYFKDAKPDEVVAVLKAREPARIMIAIGDKAANRWHLQFAERWVVQYNFYINDAQWGRMFVRMCPYLPFSARGCLNQHHWLANRMREEGIDFRDSANAFMGCADAERLQELADELTSHDLVSCGQKWLACFTPFFTAAEREEAGCRHRLFFAQTEFCDNLIFHRRAALDKLGERLLDANRTIGQPNKITTIFGRKIGKLYRGKLQTEIENLHSPNPVIRSHYRNGFIKQYVRDHLILRTEAATNNVTDYGVRKAVDNLPALRDTLSAINDNYLNVQQDIIETFIDRGHWESWRSRRSPQPESASPVSSSTTRGNSRSCTRSMEFEFDPAKSAANRAKHGIEAQPCGAIRIAPPPPPHTSPEPRFVAIGKIGDRVWTAVFTWRGDRVRIISVRRGAKNRGRTL